METGMSQQELQRVEVIALRRSGQIDQAEAARRLGVTVRQVRRLEAKVALRGAAGLRSGRRGRPSNHRLAPTTVTEVGRLIRAHYRDFGPTLAGEYLQERHGIALSKEAVLDESWRHCPRTPHLLVNAPGDAPGGDQQESTACSACRKIGWQG
jgi:hypothetical protein